MNAVVVCPECERKLKVPESVAGKAIRCPACKTLIPAAKGASAKETDKTNPKSVEREGVTASSRRPSAASPARRRPTEDDDGSDERPSVVKKRKRKKSSTGLIVGLIAVGGAFVLALVVGGVALLVHAVRNRTIPDAEWQSFAPANSGCTLLMPGTPVAKSTMVNGAAVDEYQVLRQGEKICFSLGFGTVQTNVLQANAVNMVMNAARDGVRNGLNGNQVREREFQFHSIPAREFEILAPDGSRAVVRLYLARFGNVHRIYMVSAGGFGVRANQADVVRFQDSFQLDNSATAPNVGGNPGAQPAQPPGGNPLAPNQFQPQPRRRPNRP
jgi:hypothetical protein